MKITLFGQLADITGSNTIEISDAESTGVLVDALVARYPALRSVKYVIAVDQQIVNEDTSLTNQSVVALLPPFSGG